MCKILDLAAPKVCYFTGRHYFACVFSLMIACFTCTDVLLDLINSVDPLKQLQPICLFKANFICFICVEVRREKETPAYEITYHSTAEILLNP